MPLDMEGVTARLRDAAPEVRGAALLDIAEAARGEEPLDLERVLGLVEAGRNDRSDHVRIQAEIAFGDLERNRLDPPRDVTQDLGDDVDETIDIPSMNVAAAIRRNMRRTPHFVVSRGPYARDEWRVGWYFDPGGTRMLFTTAGLIGVQGNEHWRIDWIELLDVSEESDGLRIETPEGTRFVPVSGRHGEGGVSNDAFLMMTVLGVLKPR
jgi:hypothetical protein